MLIMVEKNDAEPRSTKLKITTKGHVINKLFDSMTGSYHMSVGFI